MCKFTLFITCRFAGINTSGRDVMPMFLYTDFPTGNNGYSGHVINLPQDVSSISRTLPRLPNSLDIITIRREGSDGNHRDFRVRRGVIERALHWLCQNNIYYRNITIDTVALQQLPQDGNLTGLMSVTLPATSPDNIPPANQSPPNIEHLPQTFIPIHHVSTTEHHIVQTTLQDRLNHSTTAANNMIRWPDICSTPINEFNTEGYISCAFPTLFPTGSADFTTPCQHNVKHLMLYKDGRFAKHPRFRYFALNTEMRWRALQSGHVYVRQNPLDGSLSVAELRDMVV